MNEVESYGVKEKMIATTVLMVIGVLVVTITIIIFMINQFFNSFSKHTYYILDITDNNKSDVIELIEKENHAYCDSMYKIEYEQLFPDGESYTIYCKNEEKIEFGIDKVETDLLAQYIKENGASERR